MPKCNGFFGCFVLCLHSWRRRRRRKTIFNDQNCSTFLSLPKLDGWDERERDNVPVKDASQDSCSCLVSSSPPPPLLKLLFWGCKVLLKTQEELLCFILVLRLENVFQVQTWWFFMYFRSFKSQNSCRVFFHVLLSLWNIPFSLPFLLPCLLQFLAL